MWAGPARARPAHAHTRPSPRPPARGDPVERSTAYGCKQTSTTVKYEKESVTGAPTPDVAAAPSSPSRSEGPSVGPMEPDLPEKQRVVHSRCDSATGCLHPWGGRPGPSASRTTGEGRRLKS